MAKMTDGEKMVWAAVYANALRDGAGVERALLNASYAVEDIRGFCSQNTDISGDLSGDCMKMADEVVGRG